jgi:hypothetical protein
MTSPNKRAGFCTMIGENLALPFATEVLGVAVTIERVDMKAQGEIVAIFRRGG